MFADYARRVASNQKSTGTIKLQAVTQHGVVCAADHKLHLEYPPTIPIKNEYPDVVTISSAGVKTLEEINHAILKVKVRTGTYCLKCVHRKLDVCCFQWEIKMLWGCSHPNVICLFYLMTNKDNIVETITRIYHECSAVQQCRVAQWGSVYAVDHRNSRRNNISSLQ